MKTRVNWFSVDCTFHSKQTCYLKCHKNRYMCLKLFKKSCIWHALLICLQEKKKYKRFESEKQAFSFSCQWVIWSLTASFISLHKVSHLEKFCVGYFLADWPCPVAKSRIVSAKVLNVLGLTFSWKFYYRTLWTLLHTMPQKFNLILAFYFSRFFLEPLVTFNHHFCSLLVWLMLTSQSATHCAFLV